MQSNIIFTRGGCKWCDRAKELLDRNGIKFESINIDNPANRQIMHLLLPETKKEGITLPQFLFKKSGHFGGGFIGLETMEKEGELFKII